MSIEYSTYKIDSESILVRKLIGKVSIDDIIDSWKELIINGELDEKRKGVINDVCYADFVFNMDGFYKLLEYMKSESLFEQIKLAVVCDDPSQIVFPIMAENETSFNIKAFSSIESAGLWIII